jgi:hypothetical protein
VLLPRRRSRRRLIICVLAATSTLSSVFLAII